MLLQKKTFPSKQSESIVYKTIASFEGIKRLEKRLVALSEHSIKSEIYSVFCVTLLYICVIWFVLFLTN